MNQGWLRPVRSLLPAALLLTTLGCASPPVSEQVTDAASAPLVDTHWRLTQLGGRMIQNPAGGQAIGLQLQAQNPRVTGYAGCNRMFGAYTLNGEQIRFDQVGATKMACLDGDRMQVEQDYLQMLSRVSRWKIDGGSLSLLDASGAPLATFVASAPADAATTVAPGEPGSPAR